MCDRVLKDKENKITSYRMFLLIFRLLILLTGVYFLLTDRSSKIFDVLLTFVTTYSIGIIFKLFKVKFTEKMNYAIELFIFFSMYLGKMLGFYSKVANWDDFLHLSSGLILGMAAYMILYNIFTPMELEGLKKGFVAFFILIFAVAAAGFWEIFEFAGDSLLGLDSQGGSLLDTMMDIVNGTIGGAVIALLYYFKSDFFKDKNITGKL